VLTVVSSPSGGGTVRVSPLGSPNYEATATITLTAVPSAGYVFDRWSGSVAGIADLGQAIVSFKMGDDSPRVVTANFTPSDVQCSVIASPQPDDAGSVRFQPAQPSGGYSVNQSISVSAVAQTGYIFSRWTGDLAGSENPRTLLVSENKSITAIFNPVVTTYCSPSEGGSVALEPAQSSDGYDAGTDVTIRATAAKGYRFVSWGGDASGSDRSITMKVDTPKTITARFVEQSHTRVWLWVILGVVGLFGVLFLLRLVYTRMNRAALDETQYLE
jgi:trimeric autotransporter adhesin